jgi:hypothetical protein
MNQERNSKDISDMEKFTTPEKTMTNTIRGDYLCSTQDGLTPTLKGGCFDTKNNNNHLQDSIFGPKRSAKVKETPRKGKLNGFLRNKHDSKGCGSGSK